MARLGIFSGTFDPPHIGHLILAEEAYYQLQIDRLLWILTPDPPHKLDKSISSFKLRSQLLTAAIQDNPHFELSSVELSRPGPHYSIDTIRILAQQNSGCELVFLMGGDSLRDLPIWKNPGELIKLITILGVMRRPSAEIDLDDLSLQLPGLREKIRFVNAPMIEVSASSIRQRVAKDLPFQYFVPTKVYQLIIDQDLYR